VILLLLGALVRLYRLEAQSVWGDEACMVYLCAEEPGAIVGALSSPERTDVDVAPPLYFLLLHGWIRLFGRGLGALRGFSVLFGVLGIGLLVGLGRELGAVVPSSAGGRLDAGRLGLLAGVLAVIHPFWVWYSQEIRMYSLATALSLGATWALVRLWRRPSAVRAGIYALGVAAALYCQYYAVLLLGAHVLLVLLALWRPSWRLVPGPPPWRWLLGSAGAGAVSFLPWVVVMIRDFRFAEGGGGFPSYFSPLLTPPFLFLKLSLFGNEQFIRAHPLLYGVGGLLFAGVALLALRGLREPPTRFLLVLLLAPFLVVYLAASAGLPVYKSHPFIVFSGYYLLLLARGVLRLPRRWAWAVLAALLVLEGCVLVRLNYSDRYVKPRVAEAVEWLAAQQRPGDRIYAVPAVLPCPLPTMGDLLAWRYHAEGRLEIEPLIGRDAADIARRLPLPYRDGRLILLLQENRLSGGSNEALLAMVGRWMRPVERRRFESGVRDFTLVVHIFAPPAPADGPPGGKEPDRARAGS
jgi:hypothetical protein